MAGACAAGGSFGVWYFAFGPQSHVVPNAPIVAVMSFLLVIFGACVAVHALKSKVTLFADAIEVEDFLPPRRMRREEIAGRRVLQSGNAAAPQLVLLPRPLGHRQLKVPVQLIKVDSAFTAWLATVPDLDAEDVQRDEAEVAADPQFGLTPQERLDRLERARRVAKQFNAATAAVALWGMLYPRPYEVVIAVLAAIPLVAIVVMARSHGLYRFDGRPGVSHPYLGPVVMGPGMILGLRAMLDFDLLEWRQVLGPVALVAVVLTLLLIRADSTLPRRPAMLGAALLFMIAYAYGGIVEANALLDRSPPQVFKVPVISKRVTSGEHPTARLLLDRWGARTFTTDVAVPRAFYDQVKPGDPVCVQLRPGALAIPWYAVGNCR